MLVSSELKPRIERHAGIAVFARERARFEGWLKAELVDVLVGKGYDAVPEKDTIDVVCRPQEAAIELKTINTNYMCEGTAYKQKGITQNIAEVVADIKKLEMSETAKVSEHAQEPRKVLDTANYFKKMIVFVAYPLVHEHPEWQNRHLPKIGKLLSRFDYEEIIFANKVKGVIYTGLLGQTETHAFDPV
jgi:hypothetical protein